MWGRKLPWVLWSVAWMEIHFYSSLTNMAGSELVKIQKGQMINLSVVSPYLAFPESSSLYFIFLGFKCILTVLMYLLTAWV